MVTNEQIAQWKEEHGFIYRTIIDTKEYVYRTLTRQDYIDILIRQAQDPLKFDHDVEVLKKCLLTEYDEKEITKKAGIATVISEKIMLLSGFEQSQSEQL
jgi:hypothetical protein